MEQRIAAELALPRNKIDLSRGAVPGYRGHVPRLRSRFGESYGSLSTRVNFWVAFVFFLLYLCKFACRLFKLNFV